MDFQKALNECKTVVVKLFDLLIRTYLGNNKISESDQNELIECKRKIEKVSQELTNGGYKCSAIEISIKIANELIAEIKKEL